MYYILYVWLSLGWPYLQKQLTQTPSTARFTECLLGPPPTGWSWRPGEGGADSWLIQAANDVQHPPTRPHAELEHAIATWTPVKMMASVVVGGTRRKSLTLNGVDPETCMIVFKNHWAQVSRFIYWLPSCPTYYFTHLSTCQSQQVFSPASPSISPLCPIFLIMAGRQQVCACACACVLLTQTLALKHRIHLEQTSLSLPAKKTKHTLWHCVHKRMVCVCVCLWT